MHQNLSKNYQNSLNTEESFFAGLAESWTSTIVARNQIGELTGGAINARTLANHDSLGTGPKNRVKIGKKVVYKVVDIIAWMESRSVKLKNRDSHIEEKIANGENNA